MSNPWKVSAQFAAFVWATKQEKTGPRAAVKFARDNWVAFLPVADEGLGNLLIKVGSPKTHARRVRPSVN